MSFNAAFIFVFALGGTVSLASMLMGSLYFSQLIAVIAAIQFTLRGTPALVYRYDAALFAAGLGRGTLNYVPWAVYNYIPDV
ncbi:hypothetical protein FHW96_003648 [Novosphingobium sp. SG751A]|uniref:hypothetical protein n=1 Tax=Novosphingobium sp. SG751A TaxID=2587000 RepID=UPI0015560D24|nr:hypothetical protein [Novosphingobium sp. SG751A]NOW47468.1 hypothetical protein [Novosphingobium sp. SG751A]